jgi:sarcosine oxidase subunit gamma
MSYDVRIERSGIRALIELQGEPARIAEWAGAALPEFPRRPNTASCRGDICLFWIAAERWLLHAALAREAELLALAPPQTAPLDISVVLVSDTLTFFNIEGQDAAQIVAIASPLDTHSSVFADNAVSYTEAFGLKALLRRIPGGFEIAVESSFADLLADYLARATAA